jgi:hypothetical protein
MKNFALVLLALTTVLTMTPTARADQFSYNFNDTGNGPAFDATLTFTATAVPNDSGVYQISNVAGTIFEAGADITSPVTFSTAVYNDPNGIQQNTVGFANVSFIYDNLLMPGSKLILDTPGVLFGVDNLYFNLYSENGGYQWADTGTFTNSDNLSDPMVDPPLSEASEPGTLLLFGTGLLVLAVIVFRKARPLVNLSNS